jgi:hypothetical protein
VSLAVREADGLQYAVMGIVDMDAAAPPAAGNRAGRNQRIVGR